MQFSDLKTRVSQYLERGDTGVTTKIENWINDTRRDIALKYNFGYLLLELSMTLTDGIARYSLPTDFLGKLEIFLVNKSDAQKRLKFQKVQSTRFFADTYLTDPDSGHTTVVDGGTPNKYIEYGTEFEIHPTPNANAAASYNLYLWYYAQPALFSTDSDEDHISRYHFEAIIWGACFRGAVYFDDSYKKDNFNQQYNNSIAEMVIRENKMKTEDLNPRMLHWKDFPVSVMRRKMGLE